jgi:hypothetical protein
VPTYRFCIKDAVEDDRAEMNFLLMGWPLEVVGDRREEGLPSPFTVITIYGDMDLDWAKQAVNRILMGQQEELTARIDVST